MFQAGGFIRKLLKWRLEIYLSQVASEEDEFLNVFNKLNLNWKKKIKTKTVFARVVAK